MWAVCVDQKCQVTYGICDDCFKQGGWTAWSKVVCDDCECDDATGVYGINELRLCEDCRDELGYCCCGVMECEKDCDGKMASTDSRIFQASNARP